MKNLIYFLLLNEYVFFPNKFKAFMAEETEKAKGTKLGKEEIVAVARKRAAEFTSRNRELWVGYIKQDLRLLCQSNNMFRNDGESQILTLAHCLNAENPQYHELVPILKEMDEKVYNTFAKKLTQCWGENHKNVVAILKLETVEA